VSADLPSRFCPRNCGQSAKVLPVVIVKIAAISITLVFMFFIPYVISQVVARNSGLFSR
jgi:hypothetical protein